MMGKHDRQKSLFSYGVDLDRRVRLDHPLRKVAETVDFSFVREEVKDKYGSKGHVGLDPEVILKLIFLLFWDDVKSERELMKVLAERLDYLWFIGFSLDDDIPNHSVLSKARARWGEEVFERLFVRSIQQCIQAGLVDGSKIYMDGCLIQANASKDSVVRSSPELIDQLRKACKAVEGKLDGNLAQPYYKPINRSLLSLTDPDAPCVSRKSSAGGGDSRPRYKVHRAVDDYCGVITATKTTRGDVDEGTMVEALVDQHERHTKRSVRTVVGDSQYGSAEVVRTLQSRDIRTHMARHGGSAGKDLKIFPITSFSYDSKRDAYLCPGDRYLYRRRRDKRRKATEYKAKKGICDNCPIRNDCTKSKTGRTLMRHDRQELIDRATEQSRSKQGRKDRIRRRYLMEGSFAQGANLHGLKRSKWRRLHRQSIQDSLICAAQNIKILISKTISPKNRDVMLARLIRFERLYSYYRLYRSAVSKLALLR